MSRPASRQETTGVRAREDGGRRTTRRYPQKVRVPVGSSDLERALELASFIESASDAVVAVSADGLLTSWSDGAERLFGYSRAEIVGRSVLLLSPVGGAEEARVLLRGAQAGERVERVETERVTKDGRVLKLLVSVSPIWSQGGKFAGAVGIYGDLSGQRSAEEALEVSEHRYHSVLEALSEGVLMRDTDGHLVASNKSAERMLGLSAGELRTSTSERPLVSYIHEDGSPVLPREHPTVVSMRTGEPQIGVILGVQRGDSPIRWLSADSSALVAPDGSPPYAAVVSFTDITELRRTLAELHAARLQDLRRMALVGEYRDDDTNRHTERVANIAGLIASELELDSGLVSLIHSAAPLHDVGKIGIPDRILLKPGALTDEELAFMRTHTTIGASILDNSDFPVLQLAKEIALTHHERWDGAGYPSRLRGASIPITGRIVAVADAFDAMTHVRPYKSAFSVGHAVAEIGRSSGAHFDPQVVYAFMKLDHPELLDAV